MVTLAVEYEHKETAEVEETKKGLGGGFLSGLKWGSFYTL